MKRFDKDKRTVTTGSSRGKDGGIFIHDENALTVSVYVLIVSLFLVVCVIIGLNIEIVPELLKGLVSVISPLLYGFLIAFLISPCVSFIEKKIFRKWRNKHIGAKRVLSIVLAYILIIAIITVEIVHIPLINISV